MTSRDRIIVVVLLVVAALAGVWFLALSPKRDELTKLQAKIAVANQQLQAAQAKAATAQQAKARYDQDYATLARLGKAMPKNDALPSLIEQLQTAAHDARIDLRSLKLSTAASPSGPTNTTTNPPAAGSATGTAALPPGATIGSAGFPTMSFSFVFNGSYLDMQRFLNDVQRFVRVKGDHVDVRGRLLSVDAFALTAGPNGFPDVKATITATAYLRNADDDNLSNPPAAGAAAGATTASTGAASSTTTAPPAASSEVAR
jgi:Tfp pilus assembly protein PilO